MNNLVITTQRGELVTTSLAVATGTQHRHGGVIRLVRHYRDDLAEFGDVQFETRPNRRGCQTEYACLNEQQASLLVTYMRNSGIVRQFKKTLVKAFFELKKARQADSLAVLGNPQALRGLLLNYSEKLIAQDTTIQEQAQQVANAMAALQFVEKYTEVSSTRSFREVCKLLKANENSFRAFLFNTNILYRLNGELTPRAEHLDAERFEVKTGLSDVNSHAYNQTRFTTKGVRWIADKWAAYTAAMTAAMGTSASIATNLSESMLVSMPMSAAQQEGQAA